MKRILVLLGILATLFIVACGSSSSTGVVVDNENGNFDVDATNDSLWVYYSFAEKKVVNEADGNWDIAFNRYRIKTNSGTSGNGMGGALNLGEVDCASVTEAPANGYVVDTELTDVMGGAVYSGNQALAEWYDYNAETHKLTVKPNVYIVKTFDGKYAKFKITDYYNEVTGESGYYKFSFQCDLPVEEVTYDVDATSDSAWVYYNFAEEKVVDASEDWDIGFNQFRIRTNSGTSGNGMGGALNLGEVDCASVTEAPANGYVVDTELTDPMTQQPYNGNEALADWFNYDMATHQVSVKPNVYIIKTFDGKYVKFKITAYETVQGPGGYYSFNFKYDIPEEVIEDLTVTVNASSYTEWVYYNLSQAKVVDPETEEWDLGFNRYKIRSNSGTSGNGMCGILDLGVVDYASVTEAPVDYYTVDDSISMIMSSVDTYSANKAIESWYDRDEEMPPTLTAKENVYIVRDHNGEYAKLKLLNYYDPVSTVSGYITFTFTHGIPEGSESVYHISEVEIDASNPANWTYFSFKSGEVTAVDDPETSTEWDIAFNRFKIKTNSGVSGQLGFGAYNAGTVDFESLRMVNPEGYEVDVTLTDPMPPNPQYPGSQVMESWYNYNHETHEVTSKNEVYVIQHEMDKYAKIQMLSYQDGHYSIKYEAKVAAEY